MSLIRQTIFACAQAPARQAGATFLLAILLFALGCGPSGPSRYDVKGEVLYDGKPVPFGTILFSPDVEAGNRGPASLTRIIDGRYATRPNLGVVGGAYRVQIDGTDGIPFHSPGEGNNPEGKPLFPTYEMKVELPEEASELNIDVPPQSGSIDLP